MEDSFPKRGLSNSWTGPVDLTSCSASALKELFQRQARYLNYFVSNLEYDQVAKFCQACLSCEGVICFTGVGKSGFIAHKISQTLVATGTKAVFLSPTDALHGDIGILSEEDLLVLLFKEGDGDELLKLVPYAKAKGAKLAAVSTDQNSPLIQYCDINVALPLQRELCPYNQEPVTSTSLQILFGDTVAIALMQARRFSKDDYAMNHPAGSLGKQLMLHVKDIMACGRDLPVVRPDDKVVDVLLELSGKALGCTVVTDDENRLLGTFTDGDLRRTLQTRGEETLELPVSEVMHRTPMTVPSDMMAIEAMTVMTDGKRRVSFVPVTDDSGCVAGVLTLHMCVTAGL
mmetsp:Transcript_30013/g.76976  ORF Transcript_30013/g.76976 Transcript_30013/m.76976 type:complete len:345 (+) Transcript_30013:170-1204(+)